MFYRYEIKNNGNEDILYLYFRLNYEFSKELSLNSDDDDLSRRTSNFIKNNNINFKGKKIYLVINDMIVKTINYKSNNNNIEILKQSNFYSNDKFMVTVQLLDNSIIEITLKEYLLGTIINNIPCELDDEVIKAICILYRTYAFYLMDRDKMISNLKPFWFYKPLSYFKLEDNKNSQIYKRLSKAIDETDCLFISYNGKFILPFTHYSNIGNTFEDKRYPFLSSVGSIWDLASKHFVDIKDYTFKDVSQILGISFDKNSQIKILDFDSRNYINSIKINENIYSGDVLKDMFKLKSSNMDIIINKDFIRFITFGYGDGYGLSIFGSNQLAKNGFSFINILNYYFPLTKVNKFVQ